ncbi:MAG: 30S ribosomal protein S4 [Alphaproteobacteria bacterium]|nr:30S ribosomal protein S4 [Alphaproteobacteria bacterium]MDD9919477.1 30S ribosomal protein S4 [Alphaproteobacteria bacterium]
MSENRRAHSKYKICRRLGENLWGRDKCPTNKRPTGPGQHGARRKKLTDFGIQLREKQKLKGYYGNVSEKQFRRIFDEAARRKGDTSENLVGLLESRLDAVVYRLNFVPTVFAARQLVNHKHVLVNGQVVNIPSYRCKPGDIIQLRDKAKAMALVIGALDKMEREVPEYITLDPKNMAGEFVRIPVLDDVPYPVQMNPNLVVEFYSR